MEVLNTRNNNNSHDKSIGESANTIKTSPVLPTVRRVGGGHKTKTNQWQDFIDREQNSVDHLIQNSFATLRKDLKVDPALLQVGSSKTIAGYHHRRRQKSQNLENEEETNHLLSDMNSNVNLRLSHSNHKTSTLPRSPAKRLSSLFNLGHSNGNTNEGPLDISSVAPSGIEELEMMYAPMKNLSKPLPNANHPSFRASVEENLAQTSLMANRMPRPHPLRSISNPAGYRNGDNELRGGWKDLQIVENDPTISQRAANLFARDDDQESIISGLADIPPPLAPIQSHAVLRESLSHQPSPFTQPRSNGATLSQLRQTKPFPILSRSTTLNGECSWGKTPPLPPKRTNSKLSLLSPTVRENILPNSSFNGIYANTRALHGINSMGNSTINRTSLMSTGSSEEGTSSGSASSGESSHISSSNDQGIEVSSCTNSTTVGSPMSPVTPHSIRGGDVFFSNWASGASSYPWNSSAASATSSHSPSVGTGITEIELSNLRSVSQIGEPPDSSITGDASFSDISGSENTRIYSRHTSVSGGARSNNTYAQINRVSNNNLNTLSDGMAQSLKKESDYISILYNAVQRQGGNGSVESAMSPYLKMMKGNRARKSSIQRNVISSNNLSQKEQEIYDVPEAVPKRQTVRHRSSSAIRSSVRRSRSQSHSYNDIDFKELWKEVEQKRRYRIGLNLFNGPKPDLGIEYLSRHGFLELSHVAVARFLFKRSSSNESGDGGGLAKQKVGEYLGNLQSPFAMKVLACFINQFDFSGQRIDKSLRTLLTNLRVPGEAQKIEKIMEEFGRHYYSCNSKKSSTNLMNTSCGMNMSKLKSPDSIVTLAFAIMMLNTDLHTPNIKAEKKMTVEDFVKNLSGVDGGKDFDGKLLRSIYKAIKKQQFIGGADHVVQTQHLQQRIVQSNNTSAGKRVPAPPSNLAEAHRRLVCLCRLYEVLDINTEVAPGEGEHYRDIILFNDLLVVTKEQSNTSSVSSSSTNKKKIGPNYAYKDSFHLRGLELTLFHTNVYRHGIQIIRKSSGCVLLTLNASSEHDRYKFVMDLQESIYEMNQMEEAITEMTALGH